MILKQLLAHSQALRLFRLFSFLVIFGAIGTTVLFGVRAQTPPSLEGIAADCSVDVTAQINAYIKGQVDGATITFPSNGCYRIDASIQIIDRRGIAINGNGSTFKQVAVPAAKAGVPQWRILGGSDITLSNMTVQGVNTRASFDGNHEWDHNFAIIGTQGVVLDTVHGKNAGGDFVDIEPDRRKLTNSDGTGSVIPKKYYA